MSTQTRARAWTTLLGWRVKLVYLRWICMARVDMRWDLDLVRQHVGPGHPVITLTRYQSLPGNANSQFLTDHYVVITGLSGDDFIYNDPAFGSNAGYGLLISGPDLERAWVFSSIPGHSLALALDGDAQIPDWLRRRAETRATATAGTPEPEKLAEESEVEVADAMPAVGQVPGDQELPEVNVDTMAQTLLDLLAAPMGEERAYIANTDAVAAVLPDEVAESLVTAAVDDALVLPPTGGNQCTAHSAARRGIYSRPNPGDAIPGASGHLLVPSDQSATGASLSLLGARR